MSPERKRLLTPHLLTVLPKIAAAYGVSVEALIAAALGLVGTPGATLAAKALSAETIAALRAIPWPNEVARPGEASPLPILPAAALDAPAAPPALPDVAITVDGVHLTCPCIVSHAELRARIAADIPHLVADDARPLDLHLRRDGWAAPVNGRLTLCDGDVILTHPDPTQEQAVKQHLAILAALLDTDITAQIDTALRMTTVPVQPATPSKVLLDFTVSERFVSLEGAIQSVVAGVGRAYATRCGELSVYSAKVESFRLAPVGGFIVAIRCWVAVEVDTEQAATMVSAPMTPERPLEQDLAAAEHAPPA